MGEDTAPRITVKPELKQEDNGNKLLIYCEIEAFPKPDIKWFKENFQINDSDRIKSKILENYGRYYEIYLEIDNVTSDDSGQYKVSAKNRLGEVAACIAINFAAETAQKSLQDGIAPNFIQKPIIKSESDGKRLTFECKIKADPEPQIFWSRDNIEIADKGRHLVYCDKLPDNVYFACLEIDEVSTEDAGKYRVQAKNMHGESNATITLNFDTEDSGAGIGGSTGKPIFLQKPFIRQLEDKILFECKLSADPVPTFSWYFQNGILRNQSKFKQRILTEGKTHTIILEINNLVASDSGEYKVVAKNKHGESDSIIKLNIESTRSERLPEGIAPHFVSKPKVTQTQEKLLIQLELEANPTPSASWYLDNRDLGETDSHFKTTIERRSADNYLLSLEIRDPKTKDAGFYRSVVINELGECVANIFLQFQGDTAGVSKSDQIPPSIVDRPHIIKDEAKRTVRIECKLKAKPDPQITWLRDKQTISSSKKYKIETKKEADNSYLLSIEIMDFSPNDGGLYKILAKNESGQSHANIHLNVLNNDLPSFKEKPKDQVALDGDRVVVSCKVDGNPKPEVAWYKNKQIIKKSKDFSMEYNGEIAKLIINDAYYEDTGDYTCEIWNEHGHQSSQFKITVKEKKGKPKRQRKDSIPKPNEFLAKKKSVGGEAPQLASALNYEEEGPKRPPKLQATSNPEAMMNTGRKSSAIRLDVIDESGTKIPLTERKVKDKLELHSKTLAPFFIERPENKVITEGSNDFIEAIVDGNPFPTVTWYKGTRECLDGPKYTNEVDTSTGIVGLLIKKVKSDDESKYTIKISSEAGEESVTFSVFVRSSKDGACDFRELLRHKEYAKQKQENDNKEPFDLKHVDSGRDDDNEDDEASGSKSGSRRGSQISRPNMRHIDPALNSDNQLKVRRDSRRTSLAELIPDWPVLTQRKKVSKEADKFVKNLEDKHANEEDGKVMFSCTFCKAGGKLRWYKGKTEIFQGFKYHIETDGADYRLVINKLCMDDEGKYVCKINDIETSAKLTITPAKPKFEFLKKLPAKMEVFRTKSTLLECFVNHEDCIPTWYKDAQLITPEDKRYKINKEKLTGKCTLKIAKNIKEDEAKYSCVIEGEERTVCYLYVEEPAFRFTKRLPTQVEANEGKPIELECEIEDESAECTWFFDDKPILEIDIPTKYEIITNGLKRKLVVKKCDPKKDRGRFECKCGTITTGTELLIKPALKFTKPLQDIVATEESTLTLTVELSKPDQKLKWMRNGRVLPNNEDRFVGRVTTVSNGCTHSLTLKNVNLKDFGEFSAHVEEISSKCSVTVAECEKVPRVDLSQLPKQIKVKAGKDIELEIPYESFPIPVASWKKNGEPVDAKKSLQKNDNKKASLKIEKAQRGDRGKYELVLKNSKGETKVPIELEVLDKPSAPEEPLKVSDVTAQNATLSWQPPADNGGVPIDSYIVEKMDLAKGQWAAVETVPGHLTTSKIKLTPNKEYKFRVRAVNKEGESPNLETPQKTLAKNPYDEPGQPGTPEVQDWDRDKIDITWKPPKSDGGAPIEKYLIEKKEKNKGTWTKAAEVPGTASSASVNNLAEGKEYEFRVTAINKGGPSEPSEASRPQVAKSRFVAPRIDKINLKNITVKAGQTVTLETSFIAEPEPSYIWSNERVIEIKEDKRFSMGINLNKVKLVILDTKRSDTGKYTLKLKNGSGSDTASCDVIILSSPGKPSGPVEVKDVRKDSVTIAWKKPEDDGGREVNGYIVEKREKGSDNWERVHEFVGGTSCVINKLKEGHEYEFRVIAENQNGLGEPLQTETPILAKNPFDAPDAPGKPECLTRSREHIELGWKKPSNDGGAPIKGYNVERKEKGSKKWTKLNKDLIKDTNYYDEKVQPGKEYEYRVTAINEGGESPPSGSSANIPAKPLKEKPKFDRSDIFGTVKEIKLKAGEPINIELKIDGSPKPDVILTKTSGLPQGNSTGIQVANDEADVKLTKPAAQRADTGIYELKLKNSEGEDVLPVKITVVDKPAACQGPLEAIEATKSTVTLQWKPPVDDGGSDVSGYVVEKCLDGSNNWEKCTGLFMQPKATIKNLEEGKAYKFRVKAENIYGEGEPLETKTSVVVKPPFDPPGAPSRPEVTDSNTNFIRLQWSKPENNGGNPVNGYIIESKEKNSSEWTQCNSFPIKMCEYTATNVLEGLTYEFRVLAVNEAGPGTPSEPSVATKAEPPITKPAAVDQPRVDGITNESVTLSWKKPLDDGGSKITGYVIEKKTPTSADWEPISEVAGTNVTVRDVKENEQCQFRVRAKNNIGLSDASRPTELIKVEDQPERPTFGVGHVKDIIVKAGQNYEIHVPFKASPLPNAIWSIHDNQVETSERIEIKTLKTVASFINYKAQRSDSGHYKLQLKNSEGYANISLKVTVLDAPSQPVGPLEITNLDAESCTLAWKPPADDGGNDITNYIVEKKEVGSDKWSKVTPSYIGTTCQVRGLDEGTQYEFRVMAENPLGISEPLTTTEPITAKWPFNPPGQPGTPACVDHTENSITISWQKPKSDGGTPITGYAIEKKEKGADKWIPVTNLTNDVETEATIKGLQEGKEYEFRVAAVNKAGIGKWSQTEKAIEARPPDCAPKVLGYYGGVKEITIRNGETLRINLPIQCSPKPQVSWTKGDAELKEDSRTKLSVSTTEVELLTPNATIKDSGVYTVNLKNNLGKEKVAIKVTVVDKPSKPEGPLEVSDIKGDGCTLTWKPPKEDGGSPVTNYLIEKLDPQTNEWQKVSAYCRTPQYEVIGLDEGKSYKFRVFALNAEGKSVPLETDMNVIPKNPYGLPGSPTSLDVESQTATSATLGWKSPAQDGGSKIQGYNLEINEQGFDNWYVVNDHLIKGNTFTVEDLRPGVKYNFRVKAKNQSGWGQPSREELVLVLKPDFVKPESPEDVIVKKIGHKSADLEWNAPRSDGGSKISCNFMLKIKNSIKSLAYTFGSLAYIVEKKQIGSEFWVRAGASEDTKFTVEDLIENSEYEFRVKAVNKAGESEPSSTTGRFKITEYPDGKKPEFVIRLNEYEGHIGGTATFNVKFEGKPLPVAKWYKNGYEIYNSTKYQTTQEEFSSSLQIYNLAESDNYSISCVLVNPLGKETCDSHLRIKAIPKIDKAPVDQYVDAGENLKIKIPISGKGPFSLNLKKDGSDLDAGTQARFKLNEIDGNVIINLSKSKRDDEGNYTLEVANDSGSVSTSFRLKVKAPPGPPTGPLEVTNLTKSGCTLTWKPPKDDGGNKVLHYVIEKRDCSKNKDLWIPYADHCKETTINVQSLIENAEYEFRVMAVNHTGISEPLVTSQSFVAKFPFKVPDPPENLEALEVGSNFVSLSWTKPASDGGGPLIGYWLERREKGTDKWIRINTNPIQSTIYNVSNLIENREYEFRIFAENQAGLSEPSVVSKSVQVKDPNTTMLPEFTKRLEDAEVSLGKNVTFECEIQSSQMLDVRFYKGCKECFDGPKYKISQDGSKYSITVFNVTLDDQDEFSVKAKNKAGSKMSRAYLTVNSAPKIRLPERYKTTVVFEKEENVTVKIPFTSNPLPKARWYKDNEEIKQTLSNYQVELSNYCATLKINKPTKNQAGVYKLVLENSLGSDSCEIHIQIADVPEPPRFLAVENIRDESVTISWKPPVSDGGSFITNYIVERMDIYEDITLESNWSRCASTRIHYYTDESLTASSKYQYRVIAENLQGRSAPCEPTSVITTLEKENFRRKRWIEDENGIRRRGKEGLAPSDYDKCVHNLWARDAPQPVDIKAGSIYDYYDIYEELGSGAFGVVHRAVEKKTGKTYAVKFIKTPSLSDKTTVKKECDLMNQLIHPRLLNLHDLFDEGDEMAIVTEFLSGGELFEKISDSNYKMTEYEAKRYIRQICEGLKHMHEINIVHLNIKPENIMFESKTSTSVKLIDFGLAARLDPDEVVKVSFANTEFAAPEIIDHDSVGFSTDMWAVGILTYVILSGIHPFGGLDQSEISENIRQCDLKFPSNLFDKISENGKNFIKRLLIKNKGSRMNVFEALEHPWLNLTDETTDHHLAHSMYDNIRKRIRDSYATWPKPNPAIGRLANYSSLKKLRPKEYSIYSSYFDRRDAAPRFVIRPRNQHVVEGQSAQFICFIIAASPPVVTWYFGNNELKQSMKYMKKYDKNCYILEVKRCTLKDIGEYIVKAVNSYGERDYNAFLNVDPAPVVKEVERYHEISSRVRRPLQEMEFDLWKEPDAKATFTFKLRPRLIQVGIGVKLLCCLSGKPTPRVQWFKGSAEIDPFDTHYQIEFTSGVCTLEIASCFLSDAGVYKCRAENELGFDETICNVTVEECKYKKPKALIQELEPNNKEYSHKRESFDLTNSKYKATKNEAPKFGVKLPSYKYVKLGENIEIRCSFLGFPYPKVQWLKNGESLPIKSRIQIKTSDFDSVLHIKNIEDGDEGEYSCKVSNSEGIDVSKCQIELHKSRLESIKQPIKLNEIRSSNSSSTKFGFSKHLQSQNLIQGKALILECSVFGAEPLEVIWLRNGKEIPENPDFIRESKGNNYKITVNEVFPEDSGVFSAELFDAASNQAVMSSCSIIVQASDDISGNPKFVQFPSNYNLDEGSTIKIETVISGSKPLTVKWFKNNQEVCESDRIKFVNNENTFSLLISTVLSTDDGQYYVVATNNNGEATAAFCLIVSFEINDSNLIDVKKILEKSIEHN